MYLRICQWKPAKLQVNWVKSFRPKWLIRLAKSWSNITPEQVFSCFYKAFHLHWTDVFKFVHQLSSLLLIFNQGIGCTQCRCPLRSSCRVSSSDCINQTTKLFAALRWGQSLHIPGRSIWPPCPSWRLGSLWWGCASERSLQVLVLHVQGGRFCRSISTCKSSQPSSPAPGRALGPLTAPWFLTCPRSWAIPATGTFCGCRLVPYINSAQ